MRAVYDELYAGEKGLRTSGFVRFVREEQGQVVNLPKDRRKELEFSTSGEKIWKYEDWLAYLCYYSFLEEIGRASCRERESRLV